MRSIEKVWCVTLGLHRLSWGRPAPRKRAEAFITTVQPHHFTARFGTFPIYFYQTGPKSLCCCLLFTNTCLKPHSSHERGLCLGLGCYPPMEATTSSTASRLPVNSSTGRGPSDQIASSSSMHLGPPFQDAQKA